MILVPELVPTLDGGGGACGFSPRIEPQPERAPEVQRAVRLEALLQLIADMQRRRSSGEVAQVAAARWKHCANIGEWRLLCVYGQSAVIVHTEARQVTVDECPLADLGAYDADTWQTQLPRQWTGSELAAERPHLPPGLAEAAGEALSVLPLMQGGACVAVLSAMSGAQPFDAMDRKFIALVGSAIAARIVALLTESTLSAELVGAERALVEQRHVVILGRLVNGVAHQLNTPLGVLLSACDALAEQARQAAALPADLVSETAALMAQQASQAAAIVTRLKQVSALTHAGQALPTPLLETLEAIAAMQAQRPGARGIVVAGPEDFECLIDRGALQAVITELLDNARVHGAGPTRLELARSGQRVQIDISDGGSGLTNEARARYFEPFFTTRPQGAGTSHMGLGGYIVRNLAHEALGAEVQLESTKRGGLRVRLVIACN